MTLASQPDPDLRALIEGVRRADRAALGRAITLVESAREQDRSMAEALFEQLPPGATPSWRIGVTGPPGAGKSTLIDALGTELVAERHRVAVLAVDPSSPLHGGSLLGDKARMTRLAKNDQAFVRPAATGGRLGGLTASSYEVLLLLELAGFDVVLVETVGVGQAEASVRWLVDAVLLVETAWGGDEIQALKRGLLEVADVVAVNKADVHRDDAEDARRKYETAFGFFSADRHGPTVALCSAQTGEGVGGIRRTLEALCRERASAGSLTSRRREQRIHWMWRHVEDRGIEAVKEHPGVRAMVDDLTRSVGEGLCTPVTAARRIGQASGLF